MLTPNLHSHVRLNAQSGDILEIALRESSIPKSALPTFNSRVLLDKGPKCFWTDFLIFQLTEDDWELQGIGTKYP